MLRNPEARYGSVAHVLDWLIAAPVPVMLRARLVMVGLLLDQPKFDVCPAGSPRYAVFRPSE